MKVIHIVFVCVYFVACDSFSGDKSSIRIPSRLTFHSNVAELNLRKKINPDTSYLETLFRNYELVNLNYLDSSIKVKLPYSSTDNFTGKNLYDGLRHAYFPCEVASRLCNAQYYLKKLHPDLSLCVLDAVRPLHIQQMMWDSLKMPPDKKFNYLAAPFSVSLHNYGCAVDLTIVDANGNELDMGTSFDSFEKLSEPVYENLFLARGELSDTAYKNRIVLRRVMKKAGFSPIKSEWWHFNYCSKDVAAARFSLVK